MRDQDQMQQRTEPRPTLRPRVDTFEREDAYELVLELAGVTQDDVTVTLEEGLLTVRAERRLEAPEGFTLGLAEFGPDRFQRDFRLSDDLDPEGIEARLEHGLLRLTLHRREPKRRTITIQSESS